jgi:hypothetical protein
MTSVTRLPKNARLLQRLVRRRSRELQHTCPHRGTFQDIRERLNAPQSPMMSNTPALPSEEKPTKTRNATKVAVERKGNSSSRRDRSPVLVKDLDLAPKGNRPGLKDFAKSYRKLKSSMDLNSLFVYYLTRHAGVSPITIDHVYSCYKHVGERVPKVLTQSLWDTARKKGTIDTASVDDIKLTTTGENWVEHDLEKAAAE